MCFKFFLVVLAKLANEQAQRSLGDRHDSLKLLTHPGAYSTWICYRTEWCFTNMIELYWNGSKPIRMYSCTPPVILHHKLRWSWVRCIAISFSKDHLHFPMQTPDYWERHQNMLSEQVLAIRFLTRSYLTIWYRVFFSLGRPQKS